MKSNVKFYTCKHCGNVIVKVIAGAVTPVCCGTPMSEIIANTNDASKEKHLPVIIEKCECGDDCNCAGCFTVEVGSVEHPMESDHYISFVYVDTQDGGKFKHLTAGDKPKACFCCCHDVPVAVYAYCNKHGLWKTDVK